MVFFYLLRLRLQTAPSRRCLPRAVFHRSVKYIFKFHLCKTNFHIAEFTPAQLYNEHMVTCLRNEEVFMSKDIKSDHKHLTLSDRIYIEQALIRGDNFRMIAQALGKDPTTISLEIRRFLEWNDGLYARDGVNDCAHYSSCDVEYLCGLCELPCKNCLSNKCTKLCPSYDPIICEDLKSPPYVCNGCRIQETCQATHYYYRAEEAQKRYKALLSESREGINMTEEQLKELDDFISPLISNGQPLSHIFSVYGDKLPCSRKTIYNYLDMGLFTVKNVDLPRRVRYKLRKKRRGENPVKYAYRNRRTYKDFLSYTEAFPEYEVVEMDTVKGSRDAGKCLMTLLFRKSSFMLIFLLPSCTQASVKAVFDMLYEKLGPIVFRKTFRIILTDNGPEFKDPWSIEKTPDGKRRSRVFYCDPYKSNQKGRLEKNHEFIRYIIPKGRSMHDLTEETVRLMTCHINSVARDGLNGKCPFDLAKLLLSEKVLTRLGLQQVSPDEVILKPALLKK